MKAVEQLAPAVGTSQACQSLAVPRCSYYRSQAPAPSGQQSERRPPTRALSVPQRQRVLEELHSERFVDKAPAETYAALLDEGVYLCSVRTMYRILSDADEVRERRNQVRHPHYQKPELLATGPNQVWSWDRAARRSGSRGDKRMLMSEANQRRSTRGDFVFATMRITVPFPSVP